MEQLLSFTQEKNININLGVPSKGESELKVAEQLRKFILPIVAAFDFVDRK